MARIPKEQIEAYFEYGVDIANRRVFLFRDIDASSIGTVIKGLYLMDSQSQEKKPIELFIGSYGGDEYEMFALYDVTRTLKSPIHTVAIGKCMSAAPLLVAGGHPGERCATPNTFFMVHDSWLSLEARRVEALRKDIVHIDEMSARWYELMQKHSKQTKTWWKRQVNKPGDYYFSAEEAMDYGIVDYIWDEKDGLPPG